MNKQLNPTELSFDDIIEGTYQAGNEWAEASTINHRYREGEKAKLARIKVNIRATQSPPDNKIKWTREDLEDAALASDEWKKYLEEWENVYELMLKNRNTFDAWQSTFEAKRSTMASERTLGKLG